MTLVTVQELSNYMSGSPITPAQEKSAELILDGVINELEMYINRPVQVRNARELVRTDIAGFARLAYSPVQAVTKVSYVNSSNLSAYPSRDYPIDELVEDPNVQVMDMVPANLGYGLITSGGINLGAPNAHFIIEYRGGGGDRINQYLPAIKLAVLRTASREWEHLHKDTVRINNGDIGDDVDPGVIKMRGWDTEELKKFDRIRRRAIV
ncbi:head-to-tail complex protein [Brevibacterium phage Cantare]|uniref:Head-to-tail complex protein n=1 Tax=Brevibacterium phage Cantare TaxID=2338395 RepID=A0A3G3LZ04_9CAUD|nr:head-to-tail complex protein [Brevibacterium phage Cantare]AYQ99237.1 head-to-tail complex protein [Brevibacterium phage Cantare]